MRIPLIELPRVLHIGTLDPADRGGNAGTTSFEGHCLSVSLCPHAWREIAELGEDGLHEMTNGDGLFVDLLAVARDPEMLEAVLGWARSEGLVEDATAWRAWTLDTEEEVWRSALCDTLEEARMEADRDEEHEAPEDELEGPDGRPAIEAVTIPRSTARLEAMTGMNGRFHKDATEAAIMAWAMEEAPTLLGRPVDGVWWRLRHDPDSLVAPCGGIFPERVAAWAARPLDWEDVDDDEELDAMPDTAHAEPMPTPTPR